MVSSLARLAFVRRHRDEFAEPINGHSGSRSLDRWERGSTAATTSSSHFSEAGNLLGVCFPDVFSFAIPALVRAWWYATGATSSLLPDPHGPQHFQFVWTLYYASHSLVVFGVGFAVAWLLFRRPMVDLLAWGLYILIDIPTHQGIFALHFLWPLSSYGFSGVRWENHWFLTANYAALFLLYSLIGVRAVRQREVSTGQSRVKVVGSCRKQGL